MSQLNSTLNDVINLIVSNTNQAKSSSFLFYFKLFSFLIIIIITFSFGLLPLYFSRYRQGTIILHYANPFSGGIFIGIGLFHLLPDASFNFEQYYRTPEGSTSFFYGFPMSYFIAFLSYSFILYLEKVAFSSEEKVINNNSDLKEPLLNNEMHDDKLISSILYKRNKGK